MCEIADAAGEISRDGGVRHAVEEHPRLSQPRQQSKGHQCRHKQPAGDSRRRTCCRRKRRHARKSFSQGRTRRPMRRGAGLSGGTALWVKMIFDGPAQPNGLKRVAPTLRIWPQTFFGAEKLTAPRAPAETPPWPSRAGCRRSVAVGRIRGPGRFGRRGLDGPPGGRNSWRG